MASPIFPRRPSAYSTAASERQLRRNRLRKTLLETLERRELLAADVALPVFAPGTSSDYWDQMETAFNSGSGSDDARSNFNAPGRRWTDPVGGAGPNRGDPATVTWSIVPDGTATDNGSGSNVIAFMDGIYGGAGITDVAQKPWFNIFQRAYDRWSEVSGLTFVYEPIDDGANMGGTSRGVAGERGDVRIGGRNIDGNFGVLAFNYFPNNGGTTGFDGDMIIDTNDSFYVSNADAASGENRGLFNVLMHEAGHGIGLGHSIPVNSTKLMEPNVTFAFLGAQHDDILGAQDLYGDTFENDDTQASARNLGELTNGNTAITGASIDEPGDDDWITFSLPSSGRLNLQLTPVGEQYEIGNQGGTTSQTDSMRYQDLSIELIADDGTVLVTANAGALGEEEVITDFDFAAGGTYHLRVSGSGTVDPQLYDLSIRMSGLTGPNVVLQPPRLLSVSSNVGQILSFNNTNDLNEGPTELVFRFDGAQFLDESSLGGIRITRAGFDGTFDDGNEIEVTPGFIGFGESQRIVTARFASALPDDLYRVEVFGADDPDNGIVAIRNINGDVLRPRIDGTDRDTLFFNLELGSEIVAVVPQPTARNATTGVLSQARDQIEVYFGEGDLMHPTDITTGATGNPTVVDPSFYQLFADNATITNADDVLHNPVSITYSAARNMAVLTFASDVATLTAGNTTFRLRIGTNESSPSAPVVIPQPADPGSTFTSAGTGATNLGVFNSLTSIQLEEEIVNPEVFPLDFPGAPDTPGDREILDDPNPNETHLLGDIVDSDANITRIYYTFNKVEAFDTNDQGIPLFSAISPQQENRAREVFEFYGSLLGIDFIETQETSLPAGERVLWITTGELDGTGGALAVAGGDLVIMDASEVWDDRFGQSDTSAPGLSYFAVVMHEIGHLLGLGHATELPPGTSMGGFYSDTTLGGEASLLLGNTTESIFPGSHDVAHGRYIHRTDSRDIDLYRFEVGAGNSGEFTAEVVAERQAESSTLDSVLTLYQELPDGSRQVIAVNDDYFSDDSFLRLDLAPGVYYLGVSASGNSDYDPTITDSGLGGASEGDYQLRTTFRPLVDSNIVDVEGSALDGDADGIAGGVFNYWFDTAETANTIYVDKVAPTSGANGSLGNPFNRISDAFAAAQPGDVVRILPNGGADGDVSTAADNLAYEIGRGGLGNGVLQDGEFMNVPQGVAVVIDAGALFKMGGSVIGVGSSTSTGDLSGASLQVLGTPEQQVLFTSYTNEDLGVDTNPLSTTPSPGEWGGIIFRNALDRAEGRFDAELDGRFVNYVAQTDFTYGGGQVSIDGQPSVVTPLHMVTARPTLMHNTITLSAAAAISADPNSFEESTFVTPRFQADSLSTPDYNRVGPEIHDNTVADNSLNGLFVRVETLPGQPTSAQTVSGRWNDTDIVHIVADTLTVAGTPGGPFIETRGPELVTVFQNETNVAGGQLSPGTTYSYKMTFVDANGNEGIGGSETLPLTLTAAANAIELSNLTPAEDGFVARRLYRSDDGGTTFFLVAELDRSSTVHVDSVALSNTQLSDADTVHRARLDASLVIDPGSIVKLQGGRIVSGIGAQVVAEGSSGKQVVFTSRQDDRYGAGSTFDTNNDGDATTAQQGDWGGLYFGHMGAGSLDYALVTFGGGITSVGGTFAGFNAIEVHQANVRIANSVIEDNADGNGGPAGRVREGAGFNEEAAIFVRGSQPIIVDNIIRDNDAPAISIDAHSTNAVERVDHGRTTGLADRREAITENKGPLLRGNALANNDVNAMVIRGVTLNNQSVWDDTDIVHAVFDQIFVPDLHIEGGLRLQSSPDESLVVKFGPNAGLTSTGRPLDIDDRIGGTLQVVGSPGFPVILTSIADDTVGAGFGPSGASQNDTNNDGNASVAGPGDWRSLQIGEFSNDRNVATVIELEPAQSTGAGVNGIPGAAQNLGLLGRGENASDDNLRLGYVIAGTINNTDDIDVYSFTGTAGTEVWLDIDKTHTKLDAVVELVDAQGNILALSDNSLEESTGAVPLVNNLPADNHVNPMQDSLYNPRNFGNSLNNTFADFYSTNPLDPGLRVILPGADGSVNPYFVRVRSSNIDSRAGGNRADLEDPAKLSDGLTEGQYELQIRLRQTNEWAGSTVTFADIRFATNGVEVLGQPGHSPLAAEAIEVEAINNDQLPNALDLGNFGNTDRAALGVAGELQTATDVDWYRFRVEVDSTQNSGLAQHVSTIIDVDYADGLSRANTSLWLFYDDQNGRGNNGIRLVNFGTDSNIADDVAAPLNGTDIDDLSRGSAGLLDAFIGSQALPSGDYFLAITSNQLISSYLQQFYSPDAGGNPLTRVEPVNSVDRIFEARDGSGDGLNPVPFTLGDVPLYVSASTGTTSDLVSVSPFTGDAISRVSRFAHVEDIAIRGDGTLHGTLSPVTGVISDATEGGIIDIDTAGDGASNQITANSGIQTFFADFTQQPPNAVRDFDSAGNQNGAGLEFLGLTYPQSGGSQSLFAVGSRKLADTYIDATGFQRDANNYIYRLDPETFAAVSAGPVRQNLAQATGAGTQIREHAYVDTTQDLFQNAESQFIRMRDATPFGNAVPALLDGERVAIETPDGLFQYEWSASQLSLTLIADTEPQAQAFNTNQVPTNFFFDTTSFEISTATGSQVFETDTGRVLVNNYNTIANPQTWDGSGFVIQDLNGNTVTFEFDSNNALINPIAAPIVYDAANDGVDDVTQAIINTIRNPPAAAVLDAAGNPSTNPWTAGAFVVPGTEFLPSGHRISITGDRLLSNIPIGTAPDGQMSPISISQLTTNDATTEADGATFSITDINGNTVDFEFEISGGTAAGNVPVILQQLDSTFVSQAIENAINNAFFANPAFIATADLVGNGPVFNGIELFSDSFVTLSQDVPGQVNPLTVTPEYGVAGQESLDDGFLLSNLYDDANPATAGLPGSLDGALLTITSDLGDTVVFEFDDAANAPGVVGSTNGVAHTPVPYDPAIDTRATISATLANTINANTDPNFGVTAFVEQGGDVIRLLGEANVTVSEPPTLLFDNQFAGDILNGGTFTITDTSGDVITFEFEDPNVLDGTVTGNSVIFIDEAAGPTAAAVTGAIVNAINNPDAAVLAGLAGTWEVGAINPLTTDQIWLRNATAHETGRVVTLINSATTLVGDESFEGVTFTVTDKDGDVVTFELDDINTAQGADAGNSVVPYDSTLAQTTITDAIVMALNAPDAAVLGGAVWDVTAEANLAGNVFISGSDGASVDPAVGIDVIALVNEFAALGAGQSYDGATFTVTDADGDVVTFEIEDTVIGNGVSTDNTAVPFNSATDGALELSNAIAGAINGVTLAGWDATAVADNGNGLIKLANVTSISVAAGAPVPTISNDFTALGAGETYDGATFTITDADGDVVTFELNDTTTATPVAAGNSAIDYDSTGTREQLTAAILNGINNPDPAVLGGAVWDVTATLATGSNQIELAGSDGIAINVGAAPIVNPLSTYESVNPLSTQTIIQPLSVDDLAMNPLVAAIETPTNPLAVTNLPPISTTNFATPLEEYFTNVFTFDFNPLLVTPGAIDAIAATINASGLGVTATVLGNRLVLDGATDVDPTNMPTMAFSRGTPGAMQIPFDFTDTAAQLNTRLLNVIQQHDPNARLVNGQAIQLSATASINQFLTDDSQDNPERNAVLSQASQFGDDPNGGLLTGLAYDGAEMFAVSDTGDLYEVVNFFGGNFIVGSPGQVGDYINTILDDDGNRISFSSVTTGPRNAQNGAFADLLFGIDDNGRLYSFTKEGRPAHVLQDGGWWVDTGIGGASGLAFSTLDVNLWHDTTTRQGDDGHGINISFDGERPAQGQGGTSLYFGFQDPRGGQGTQPGDWSGVNNPGDTNINTTYDPGIFNTYDLPGGAKGTVVSQYMDLSQYSPADKPHLYFNYFLATENSNSDLGDGNVVMRDAFRVFVSGSDGQWKLLGSNNSDYDDTIGLAPADEHDYQLLNDPNGTGVNKVSELFDVNDNFRGTTVPNTWRQARVDLSDFAGDDSIRIRFDFNTAGSFDSGGIGSVELVAVAASKIQDGDQFEIDGRSFEFDMGVVIQAPSGAALNLGETFTIDGTTYTFAGNDVGTNILLNANATAADIAQAIAAKVAANQGLQTGVDPVNLGRVSIRANTGTTAVAAAGFLSINADNANEIVPIAADFTEIQVRDAIQQAIAREFNQIGQETNLTGLPVHERSIFLYGHTVTNAGPLGVSDAGTFSGSGLQGDEFGEAPGAGPVGQGAQRGQGNRFEGVYIDDVIVGFAERGEMVTHQGNTANSVLTFDENPRHEQIVGNLPSEIETGTYQIEIRRGSTYALGGAAFPSFAASVTQDTNDRFAQAVTLVAPFGHELNDGQTFTISDGLNTVTFEFDDQSITSGPNDGVAQGNVAVPFNSSDDAAAVGRSIRDAINSPDAQATLDIVAGMSDGAVGRDVIGKPSESRFVNLHGNASVNNFGSSDFDGTIQGSNSGVTDTGFVVHGFDSFQLNDLGDQNRFRDQGQVIIHSNVISDSSGFGIVVDAGSRTHSLTPLAGTLPHPGSVRNLLQINEQGLVPGPVLINNLIYANATGGILFSGDSRSNNTPEAPVPFGRIVNNTVVGRNGGGVGISVTDNASPTLLNNVVASLATGISIDGTSSTTVVGATAYQNNGVNAIPNVGTNPIILGPTDPLFVDQANRNFYPAAGSQIIDSSIDSLNDRTVMTAVRDPLGIAVSPILAPNFDVTGVLRVDDPAISNPNGTGGNPFKDRGAFDRADFNGPVATITQPIDNDPDIVDIDRNTTKIRLSEGNLDFFSILLVEPDGTGPDARTVTQDAVILTENGRLLTPGVDYVFGYNTSSRLIRLTPLAGVWRTDSVYEITINNQDAIRAEVPEPQTDGDIFEISAGGTVHTFEFDADGTVGDGNIAIAVNQGEPKFSVTTRIVRAINNVAGLQAYHQGDSQFTVHGADSISNLVTTRVGAVTDIAGNPLQANRVNSLTQFTIVMPEVEMDFGDADVDGTVMTDPVTGLRTLDAARHSILPVDAPDLFLGAGVDGEADGQRTPNADGDDLAGADEDGVVFSDLFNAQTKPADVTVNVVGSGILDVWFDWNGDGDFTDPGERIDYVSDMPVSTGAHVITITTPPEAQAAAEAFQLANPGDAFMVASRFRLSTNGTPHVGCIGIGGEVEDHMVEIVVGIPPMPEDDTYELLEDTSLTVPTRGVLDNDVDLDSGTNFSVFDEDPVTPGVQPLVDVSRGTLVLNADGSFTYTPEPDFFGQDTFVYNAIDDRLLSESPATVTINVQPVNDAPTAIDDEITIFEDESITLAGAELTGNDLRGQAGTVSAINELAQNLTVIDASIVTPDPTVVGGSISVANNEVQFTPAPHYNSQIDGPVLVEVTIQDDGQTYDLGTSSLTDDFKTAVSTLTINVTPLNDSPVYDMPTLVTTVEDAGPETEDPFITGILPGPTPATDEAAGPGVAPENQTVSFTAIPHNPELFESGPTIDANGVLTYELKPNVNNESPFPPEILVDVIAKDSREGETVIGTLFDPAAVAAGTGLTYDGATVTVTDTNGNVVVFEFDDENLPGVGSTNGVPHAAVAYGAADTAASISDALAALISNPPAGSIDGPGSWAASAFADPVTNEVHITGEVSVAISTGQPTSTLTNVFTALNAGESYDGATFTVTDADGDAITFELNDATDTAPATPGVAAGNSPIDYDPAFTQDQLSIAINNAINSPDMTVLAGLTGTWDTVSMLPAGSSQMQLHNVSAISVAGSAAPVINPLAAESFDPAVPVNDIAGSEVLLNLFDPTTFDAGSTASYDGATLTVSDAMGNAIVLEVDDAGLPGVGNTAGVPNIAIPVDGTDTAATFFDKVLDAINNPPAASVTGLGPWGARAFIDAATGEIRVVNGGTLESAVGPDLHTLTNLNTSLNAGETYDGATFTITDIDGDAITFELNDINNAATPGVAAGNSAIDFDSTFTAEQLSQAIRDAINNPDAAVLGGLSGNWDVSSLLPAGSNQLQLFDASALAVTPSTGFVVNPLVGASFTAESPFESRPSNEAVVRTFTILVEPINDAPEFDFDQNPVTLLEDAGTQSYDDMLVGIRPGPSGASDENAAQTLTFSLSFDASAYTTEPTLTYDAASGTADLDFELAPDVNNATGHDLTIVVTATDTGGTANGGVDSTSKTLTLDVTPVNDAPSFTLDDTQVTVFEDEEQFRGVDPTVFVGFANGVEGPSTAVDETTLAATKQTLTYEILSVSDPSLFEVQPTISSTGDLSFKTATDKNGSAEVVVRLLDDGADSTTGNGDQNQAIPDQTFTINLTPVNDAPTFDIPATHTGTEDQGFVAVANFATNLLPGTSTATDEAGQQFVVDVVAAEPGAFTVQPAIAADGTLTYQTGPDVNSDNADLRIFVTLTDDGTAGPLPDNNTSETKTVTLVTTPVNDAPEFTLNQNQITVIEDVEAFNGTTITTVTGIASNQAPGPVTATDETTQNIVFDVVSVSAPELFEIQPSVSPAGDLTFKTAQHKNGNAFVVIRLVDDGAATPPPNDNDSVLQTLTITITPINDAPEFELPGTLTVNEDEGLISQNSFATNVRRGPAGTDDENSQQVSFSVVATDPSAFAVQPSISPDGTITFQTAQDVNSNNANLEVKVKLTDSGPGTPAPNQNMSEEKTFTIIVNPVNDPPIPDSFNADTDEDASITINAADVLVGDVAGPSDELGQSLTLTQIERTSARGGTIVPVFSGNDIVSFTYTPPADATGIDTFLYVVTDDGTPERSGSGTITINITGVNDPPEFTKGRDITVAEDVDAVSITAWATGILPGPQGATDEHATQTVSFDVSSNNPSLFSAAPAVSSDGTLTFTPAADANGTAVVTVTAIDDGSNVAPNSNTSDAQTFTITVTPVNDAPVFTSGANVSVPEDSGAYSEPWATDIAAAAGLLSSPQTATDESGQQVNFNVANDQPALFTVQPTVSSTGQLEFTPAQDAVGTAVVTVTAVDQGPTGGLDENTSAPQTFTITITPVNDAPVAVADTYTGNENQILSVGADGIIGNDTDVDLPNDLLRAVPATTTSSLGAVVVISEDGSFTYDPTNVVAIQQMSNGQSVLDSFVYSVEDSAGLRDTNAVSINVEGVDDPPVAVDDAYSLGVGQSRLLDILANDTDIDTAIDPRTIVITTLPISGTAVVNQTGVVDYSAGPGFRGTDTFGYTVRDGAGNLSNEALVTITVNNPPIAVDDTTFTFKNEPVDINVLGNDSDPDGTLDPATVQIVAGPTGGSAVVQNDGTVTFTPDADFFGNAQFSYVVEDEVGTSSNVADVLIRVQRSRWQNPTGNMDVNADGFISPIDALIIVNYLNGGGETFLPDSGIVPAPFLDPNGDENVTPIDALMIINFLNQVSSGGGAEGEGFMTEEYAMTVTPQQIIDTVGPQVVSEIQSALDEARSAALGEDLIDVEDDLDPIYGPVLPSDSSRFSAGDLLVDGLTEDKDDKEDSLDQALEELFGGDVDDFIGPRLPR